MSQTIGSVIIDVKADTQKLVTGFDKAERTVTNATRNMKNAITGLATAYLSFQGVNAFSSMIKGSIDAADKMSKLAEKLAIGTQELSRLEYAGGYAAVSIGKIEAAMGAMIRRTGNFKKDGTGAASKAMEELGISVEFAQKNFTDTNTTFLLLLDRLSKVEDATLKTKIAQDLFSKSAADVVRLAGMGADELKRLGDEGERVGAVISDDMGKSAALLNDNIAQLESNFSGLANEIAREVIPALNGLYVKFQEVWNITTSANKKTKLSQLKEELQDLREEEELSLTSLGKKYWSNDKKAAHEAEKNFIKAKISLLENELFIEEQKAKAKKESLSNGSGEKDTTALSEKQMKQNLANLKVVSELKFDMLAEEMDEEERLEEEKEESLLNLRIEMARTASEERFRIKAEEWEKEEALEQAKYDLEVYNAQEKANAIIAGLEFVKSAEDRINESYLETYELMKDFWSTEQLDTFFSKWNKNLKSINKESKKYEGVGSKDWTAGLTGTAKGLANISNAFADIAEEQQRWDKFSKENNETEDDKNQHLQNQLSTYSNLAGAAATMFEEGSSQAQAMQQIQTALAVVEGGLAVIHQMTSGDVYTAIPRALAVAAMVQQALSGSGGGASFTPPSAGDLTQGNSVGAAFEQFGVDTNQSLEDAIEELTAKIEVQTRIYEKLGDHSTKFSSALTLNTADLLVGLKDATIDVFKRLDLDIGGQTLKVDYGSNTLQSDTISGGKQAIVYDSLQEMIEALGDDVQSAFNLSEDFLETTGQYQENVALMFSDLKSKTSKALTEYTESTLDLYDELDEHRETWVEVYEEATGDNKYTSAKVKEAFTQLNELKENIGATSIAGVYETLIDNLSVDWELVRAKYNELSQADFTQWLIDNIPQGTFNPAEIYKYIGALETAGEAFVTSENNIKEWTDSLKSPNKLLSEMAHTMGVRVATTTDELDKLFLDLAYDTDGLVDAERELLEITRDRIEADKDAAKQLDDLTKTQSEKIQDLFDSANALLKENSVINPVYETQTKYREAESFDEFIKNFYKNTLGKHVDTQGYLFWEERYKNISSDESLSSSEVFNNLGDEIVEAIELMVQNGTIAQSTHNSWEARDESTMFMIRDTIRTMVEEGITSPYNQYSFEGVDTLDEWKALRDSIAPEDMEEMNEAMNALFDSIENGVDITTESSERLIDWASKFQSAINRAFPNTNTDTALAFFGLEGLPNSLDDLKSKANALYPTLDESDESVAEFTSSLGLLKTAISEADQAVKDSANRIDTWNYRNETAQETAIRLAQGVGVDLINFNGGIDNLATSLINNDGLLSQEEADTLYAVETFLKNVVSDRNTQTVEDLNKDIDKANDKLSAFQDELSGIGSELSTLEGVFDSLDDVIYKLRKTASTDDLFGLNSYKNAMSLLKTLDASDNAEEYSEAVTDAIAKSDELFEATNFETAKQQKFEQLVAANRFTDIKRYTLTEIDYLQGIEAALERSIEDEKANIESLEFSIDNVGDSIVDAINALELSVTIQQSMQMAGGAGSMVRPENDIPDSNGETQFEAGLLAAASANGGYVDVTHSDGNTYRISEGTNLSDSWVQGVTGWAGFSNGGYTGDSLGIVHPNEYVLNAETSSMLGLNDSSSTGVFGEMVKEIKELKQEIKEIKNTNEFMAIKAQEDSDRAKRADIEARYSA